MSSEVSICNIALRHIGLKAIASLNESRQEARDCSTLFDTLRDFALRDHPWTFASKEKPLTPFTMPTDYDVTYGNAYVYPTDAIKLRYIRERGDKVKLHFRTMRAPDNTKIVLTDAVNAVAGYTMRVTDPTWFDVEFSEALALLLASRLAIPLRQNLQLEQLLFNKYMLAKSSAEVADIKEDNDPPEEEVPWITARG